MRTTTSQQQQRNLLPKTLNHYRTVSQSADTIVESFINECHAIPRHLYIHLEQNDEEEEFSFMNLRPTSLKAQHLFLHQVIQHSSVQKFPVPAQFTHKLLKRYIFEVEHDSENEEGVSEELMDLYWKISSLLPSGQDSFSQRHLEASHRIYDMSEFLSGGDRHKEAEEEVSSPMTASVDFSTENLSTDTESHSSLIVLKVWPTFSNVGLAMWEAGYVLAEWILANSSLFRGKRVLELGSGVGLSAMALARSFDSSVSDEELPSAIYMTDYMNVVLRNCVDNMKINNLDVVELFGSSDPNASKDDDDDDDDEEEGENENRLVPHRNQPRLVHVSMLDWTNFSDEQLHAIDADVILAADLVYDISVIEDLVKITSRLIFNHKKRKTTQIAVYFAITQRNENTFHFFKEQCGQKGIDTEDVTSPLPQLFPCYEARDNLRMYKLTAAAAVN